MLVAPAAEILSKLLLLSEEKSACLERTQDSPAPPGRKLQLTLLIGLSRASLIRDRNGQHLPQLPLVPKGPWEAACCLPHIGGNGSPSPLALIVPLNLYTTRGPGPGSQCGCLGPCLGYSAVSFPSEQHIRREDGGRELVWER